MRNSSVPEFIATGFCPAMFSEQKIPQKRKTNLMKRKCMILKRNAKIARITRL